MIGLLGNEDLIANVKRNIKNNTTPHCQLINDCDGLGGLSLGMLIAEELLEKKVLEHPDFNLFLPLEKDDLSENSFDRFKGLFSKMSFCGLSDWSETSNSNTLGQIKVKDVVNLHEKVLLKAFKGKNKVIMIWGPEFLNITAGNKLLKILEEPPENTYFILITESIHQVLPTIVSRSFILNLNKIPASEIEKKLIEIGIDNPSEVSKASLGSWRRAIRLSEKSAMIKKIELIWIDGLRAAFRSNGNKKIVLELMNWADKISASSRDEQRQFLEFGSDLIRNALAINYSAKETSSYLSLNDFKIEKLAPYIHSKNIMDITNLINDAYYEIKRNANTKILFSNFILKIARFLNRKED